ncbi:SDR family oxidoreductase [Streptomyces olivaceoviridis]|uniref:SDR family oxidoreductase n=1 Tax=Streptomyces olivaceoviridis TaxID=1921 RepID=UPI0033201D9E
MAGLTRGSVTGSSQGIGAALADACRKLGHGVVATSRGIAASEEPGVVTTSLVDHAGSAVPSVPASLTKDGLQSATKAPAIEYADRGVRGNAVALGVIKTPMHPESSHETLAGPHPLGRMGEVGDVVDAVVHLENAPFATGEILHVDGGQSAGH